jgi:hypothetical protein
VTAPSPAGERLTPAAMQELRRRAADGRVVVIALTDEELTALDGPEADQVAPRPWYDAQDDATRETACVVALRGLAARGIALPSQVLPNGDVNVALPDDVHAALAMRRAASVIVVAHQQVHAGMQARVLYGQGPRVVLEEHVTGGGLHTFSVAPRHEAVDDLVALVDPGGVAGADGPRRTLSLTEVAAGRDGLGGLDDSRCVTIFGRIALGDAGEPVEERVSVYALADRVEVAEPREVGPETVLEVGPVSSPVLRARLEALLADGPAGPGS